MIKDVTFDGIVIKNTRYKESDALVIILTKQYGPKTFLIRGVRKAKSKNVGSFIPFTIGQYIGSINEDGLSYITATNNLQNLENLTTDIEKSAYASFILDIARHAFQDIDEVEEEWFTKIIESLKLIDKNLDAAIISNIMQIQLLDVFGVKPELEKCVICGKRIGNFDYSEMYGGLLCEDHYSLDDNRLHAGQRVIYYLRLFSKVNLISINSISVKISTKNQLQHIIDMIYDDSVGIKLKSREFLNKINDFHF